MGLRDEKDEGNDENEDHKIKKGRQISHIIIYKHKFMLGNPNGKFQTLVTKLLSGRQYEVALQQGSKLYHIKQYHVEELTPNKIVQMYYLITTKLKFLKIRFYYNRLPGENQSWYQNELRVFIWLVVGYGYLHNKPLSTLNQTDWVYFSQIFNLRNPDMFEFQTRTILKKSNKCTKWERQEVNLLDNLIKAKSIKNRWNEIAKELFILSAKKYFRTPKQCRQHWINHLNSHVVRSSWTASQDLELVQAIIKHGKKWSKVSKILGGKRTEHMVKNRFKSLFHFESKKFQAKDAQNGLERQIMMSLVSKLKKNIEEGNKLSEKRESIAETLKLETQIKSEDLIYEEENDFDDYIPEEQEFNKSYQEMRREEDPPLSTLPPTKINQLFQEDCINMFFHESCMLQR